MEALHAAVTTGPTHLGVAVPLPKRKDEEQNFSGDKNSITA